jgi:hypothetical protein
MLNLLLARVKRWVRERSAFRPRNIWLQRVPAADCVTRGGPEIYFHHSLAKLITLVFEGNPIATCRIYYSCKSQFTGSIF